MSLEFPVPNRSQSDKKSPIQPVTRINTHERSTNGISAYTDFSESTDNESCHGYKNGERKSVMRSVVGNETMAKLKGQMRRCS